MHKNMPISIQAIAPGIVLLACFLISLNGCATIIKGGTGNVTIKSEPADAAIKIVDLRSGQMIYDAKTPQTVSLKRGAGFFMKSQYKVTIEKNGYETKEINFSGNLNAWYLLGNLVLPGGLFGYLFIDPLTGAMWDLYPDDISVVLYPVGYAGPSDFIADEFTLPFSIEELCQLLSQDTCDMEFISEDKTTQRLNEILEIPDLYERLKASGKLSVNGRDKKLPDDILELLEETKDYRVQYSSYHGLNFDQQERLKKLNRRLIEEAFPSPKKGSALPTFMA